MFLMAVQCGERRPVARGPELSRFDWLVVTHVTAYRRTINSQKLPSLPAIGDIYNSTRSVLGHIATLTTFFPPRLVHYFVTTGLVS